MVKNLCKRCLPLLLAVMLVLSAMPLQMLVSATTVNVLDGQVSVTDTESSINVSGDVVTVTAKGSLFSATTNTITITNETKSTAKLTFNYSASGYSSFSESSASGAYEATLDSGASVTMSIKGTSGFSSTNGVLELSNFSLVAAASSSNVTFNFDSTYGSVTVDGPAITSGDVKSLPLTGAALVATPVSGATFLGWVDASNGSILSSAASYTITPAADMTVKAVFVGANSKPHFMIGALTTQTFKYGFLSAQTGTYYTISSGSHLFDNLTDAINASAANASSKGIVLMNDGTLPAGTYTIPFGCTLLIPFDTANTLYTTVTQGRVHNEQTEITSHPMSIYRTLTMADGANIVINGAMSLSAKHLYAQGNRTGGGSPVDNVSAVKMEGNSSITVNDGGTLYTYGYIYGSGSVKANSGATVYENFQVMDFRGGSQSTQMENGVFPFSQYYVQNIEVPITLEYGSKECSFTTIYMSDMIMSSKVDFIGSSNSMFNLTKGSVTKWYDGSTDRLVIELDGDLNVSPIELDMGMSSINSADYDLPINSNLSITAKSGSNITMNQDIAMLPGAEIILEQGANCTIGSGINVYLYDADNWGLYTGAGTNTTFKPVTYAMSRTYTRTDADLDDAKIQVDGYIDVSAGSVYTTSGGANVFSTGTGVAKVTAGTQTATHQLVYGVGYVEIPITPAKLKNADGSYTETTTDDYNYGHGVWYAGEHKVTSIVTDPTCTEDGYTTHNCPCGYKLIDTYVDETGHSYESTVNTPTCTEDGYTEHTCVSCGDSYTDSVVEALGHSFGDWQEDEKATHDKAGEESRVCSECGESEVREISQIICDINGDGESTAIELAKMRLFLLGIETPTDNEKILFDMNDDGKICLKDLVKLKRYIAGI